MGIIEAEGRRRSRSGLASSRLSHAGMNMKMLGWSCFLTVVVSQPASQVGVSPARRRAA